MTALVRIDTKTMIITRYLDGKATHRAMVAEGADAATAVEELRTKPVEDFLLIVSKQSGAA